MNRIYPTCTAVLLAVAIVLYGNPATASRTECSAVDTLVEGNSAFAVKLYRELGAANGNLLFSPYGVSSALAMTYAGARENTAVEMKAALDFQLDPPDLHTAFNRLNRKLTAGARKTGQRMNIANALCLTGGDVDRAFKALLKENYNAEIFTGGIDRINGWVRRQTEGNIERIMETLDPQSVCVLLNAVYFKGVWERRFADEQTHEAPFRLSSREQVTARLMYRKDRYRCLTKTDVQAVALPYKGEALSMVVLLPRDVDGLGELEKRLTTETLMQWLSELDAASVQEMELFLPKFRMETGHDLVPPLKTLGMKDGFDPAGKADFRGMGGAKGALWISQIKHKAVMDVNEAGTEAAAATAVEMALTSVREYPVFRADHPFIFLIREHATGSILFMGRLADPRDLQDGKR
ncbi:MULTISPECIES: serpin family protein [Desulfococcus]|jgi:serpin B|uniref:Serpin domain containing protein n=1 Tax=Desulfococcus multivorans DSM 2059 TaxID=1121405 RepID=S7TUU2_DESML|nr:serpin family protein [Desulfococcus multivorans]AOY57031.1 proteinase inhibitor I4 serpin [Desulfococcus multivorans]AQU99546.1 hypothetical protein B2D07_01275 [Desulfococcus multivorans]EPR40771.1 Serpin domain containing protein [Desulfococcus multivorans DSM 2059]MDX9817827.1 serpin family protein [Desulfococcus multivorans]SJZ89173.1 serpin B [Desulfococcus multivorans DSM 2059]